jgi:hypothetical protein
VVVKGSAGAGDFELVGCEEIFFSLGRLGVDAVFGVF